MRISDWSSDVCSSDLQLSVRYLLSLLRRRKALLLLTLAICVAIALVWTSALPKIYRSSADVVLITKSTDVVPSEDETLRETPTRTAEIETQLQQIGRESCRERVCLSV